MSDDGLVNDLTYGIFKATAITPTIHVTMIAAVMKVMGTFIFSAIIISGGIINAEFGGTNKACNK